MLADNLKQICNDKGQETNSTKSAAIFMKWLKFIETEFQFNSII